MELDWESQIKLASQDEHGRWNFIAKCNKKYEIWPARKKPLLQVNPSFQNENSHSFPLSQCEELRQLALWKPEAAKDHKCMAIPDVNILLFLCSEEHD